MTLEKPASRQRTTPDRSMRFNGLDRIRRTRRIEATPLANKGTQRQLIQSNQFDKEEPRDLHRSTLTVFDNRTHRSDKTSSMALFSILLAGGRATITTSSPFMSNRSLNDSLIRRLIRFRLTALPAVLLLTTIPILLND